MDEVKAQGSGAGEAVRLAAHKALGEWLAWPDAARDGPVAVDDEKVLSWLSGLPNKLADLSQPPEASEPVGYIINGRFFYGRTMDGKTISASDTVIPLYATPPKPEASALRCAGCDGHPTPMNSPCGGCGKRYVEPTADKALREALQPFADEAGNYDYGDGSGPDYKDAPDESSLNEMNDLLVGHLRKARAALAHPRPEGGG